jgi:hypothetical protein
MNLSKNVKVIQVLGYFAAGQTKRTSGIISMAGFEGVLFIAGFGTLLVGGGGTIDVYAEEHTLNQTSGMARIPATTTVHTVTAADALLARSCIVLDIYQPLKQYIQCNVTPATASQEILGIVAILYGAKVKPDVSAATIGSVIASFFNQSPAEV